MASQPSTTRRLPRRSIVSRFPARGGMFSLTLVLAVAGSPSSGAGQTPGPIYTLRDARLILPAVQYAGPKFSTVHIDEIPAGGITTSGGVTTVRFTMPGQSTECQLKLDPGFRWLISGGMSSSSLAAFRKVLETGVRDSNNYTVQIDGAFSWLAQQPNVYHVAGGSVLRFSTKAGVAAGNNSVISGSFADVANDSNAVTTEFWGTMVIRTSSDRTYGLLRHDASYHRRGDPTEPICSVGALPLATVELFIQDALGRGVIDVLNHCTDANNVRVVHSGSGWL